MKKLFVIFFTFVFSNAFSQWTVISTVPTAPLINSISVVNQNLIWIACDGGKVYRSIDGGLNWSLRNTGLPAGNVYGISALDTSNCWVGNVSGSIYRTSNGGASWVQQLAVANSFSDGIHMFNMNYGIYFGDPAAPSGQTFQYRYTTNGGTNWILSPNAPTVTNEYGIVNAWDWLDSLNIWIGVATVASGATSSKVYKTNGGFINGTFTFGQFGGSGTPDGLYSQGIGFTNANSGMLGTNNTGIRRTTNGGSTWSAVTNPPGLTSFAVNEVHSFKDGSNLIRFAMSSTSLNSWLYKTTDLGVTWIQETLPTQTQTNPIQHMEFVNQTLGYAGCAAGLFLRYNGPSGITNLNGALPDDFKLEQNYPNPFNPSTKINFSIPSSGKVKLVIHNTLGEELSVLLDEFKNAGNYSAEFTAGANLNSGVYFYTLYAGDFVSTKKFILVK
ncbi:MAG: T9SS type A sorting domain-containing protein [Ignavibacteria bacterium]|nr:T9SS type A sorting domain-containing protein [Ignavibacteria bacterium]